MPHTDLNNESGGHEPVGYGLDEPVIRRPDLPGEVVVAGSADELIDRLAADLVIHAENCVREFGDFHLAVSGAAELEPFYERLMYDPNYRRLPWRRTHLWFVQEHCLPFDHDRSCYRRINDTLGDHADIPAEQFHPIFAESPTADVDYEAQLREALGWREKGQDRLDFVLLALDADGGTSAVASDVADRLVRRVDDRVSLTVSLLNASRFLAIYAVGASRVTAVERVVALDPAEAPPARALSPLNGELRWYLDAPACGDEGAKGASKGAADS